MSFCTDIYIYKACLSRASAYIGMYVNTNTCNNTFQYEQLVSVTGVKFTVNQACIRRYCGVYWYVWVFIWYITACMDIWFGILSFGRDRLGMYLVRFWYVMVIFLSIISYLEGNCLYGCFFGQTRIGVY